MPGADRSGCFRSGQNLTGVDLTVANLAVVTLPDADLSSVIWSRTIGPDVTVSDDNGKTCCGHLNGAVPPAGC